MESRDEDEAVPSSLLITSQPEAHITHVFNYDRDLPTISVHRYNLSNNPDADTDIRNFLQKEFAEIRRVHRHLPLTWPDGNAISSLVERSSLVLRAFYLCVKCDNVYPVSKTLGG